MGPQLVFIGPGGGGFELFFSPIRPSKNCLGVLPEGEEGDGQAWN